MKLFLLFISLISFSCVCNAIDCTNPPRVIRVSMDKTVHTYRTIQRAISSVPLDNTQWVHIRIDPAIYLEKVTIPKRRPCIFLEGTGGSVSTILEANDHGLMNNSYTFRSLATNVVVKGLTIQNMWNHPPKMEEDGNKPAVAVEVKGDKTSFFECIFKGVQDTLWDISGRHYFHNCYIQGETDFIFGNGQSIYENCVINYKVGPDGPKSVIGYITAQGRESMNETSGFVFKGCNIIGAGKANLGRAYRAYSRVIFANSFLSDVINPEGWNAWNYTGHEDRFTYVEEGNNGPGASKSKRVPWLAHMDPNELNKFLSLSYIDQEGWLSKQPIKYTLNQRN